MSEEVKLSQTSMNVIRDAKGTTKKEVRQEIKTQIGELLKDGKISEEEAKAALKFADKDLQRAIASKNFVEKDFREECCVKLSKKDYKLLEKTGLTPDDLYSVSKLAGADYTVNAAKLTKEEKAAGKNGEQTKSELTNITNALNAKIKERGGTETISEKQAASLMRGIGLNVKTRKAGMGVYIPYVNVLLGLSEGFTGAPVFSKTKEEKAYGDQSKNSDGSVTNKTESKMETLKQNEPVPPQENDKSENPQALPTMPE